MDRQTWMKGAPRWCKHALEEVRSADGRRLYGERCRLCGVNWALGDCAGCGGASVRLTVVSLAGERFCDLDCQHKLTLRKQQKAREKAKARREYLKAQDLPLRCEHKTLEDVTNAYGELLAHRCLDCHEPIRRMA